MELVGYCGWSGQGVVGGAGRALWVEQVGRCRWGRTLWVERVGRCEWSRQGTVDRAGRVLRVERVRCFGRSDSA